MVRKMGGGYAEPYQEYIEVEEHDNDAAHEILHEIGDTVGYWPLLVAVLLGGGIVFKRKIKNWLLK